MRRWMITGLLALLLTGQAQSQAAQAGTAALPGIGDSIFPALGQRGLDVLHYDLRLTVRQPGTAHLSGDVTLTLTTREPLTRLSLDLLGPKVSAVQWNGKAAPFTQSEAKLEVTPPRPLRPGEQAQVRVLYAGESGRSPSSPQLRFRPGWQTLSDTNVNFSEPDGTRTFLPCNDHPSDPATFRVQVTVPQGYLAAASGLLVQQVSGPQQTTSTFTQRTPIPTYALALLVGRFERQLEPEVKWPQHTVKRRDVYSADTPDTARVPPGETEKMLRVLSDWFGPYPFEVYGVAVVPELPLALETATLSVFRPASSNERVRLHELAHQWFGNRVTLGDWADSWLNEGFATYAELLWAESQGEDGQELVALWSARGPSQLSRPLRATEETQLFDAAAYFRGALALHALRLQVGDAAFKRFLRAYAQTFATRPTSTAALLQLVQAELGSGAAATLREWVDSPELPPLPERSAASP